MENVIIIENSHIIAFGIGVIIGMLVTALTVSLLVPTWVKTAFKKLKN